MACPLWETPSDAESWWPGSVGAEILSFDRLLAALDWRDPAEALELEDWEDVFYPELIRIAAVRAARNGGGGRELEVRERLLAAEARGMEEAVRAFVRRLSQLSLPRRVGCRARLRYTGLGARGAMGAVTDSEMSPPRRPGL